MTDLERDLVQRAVIRGKTALYQLSDALLLVDACEKSQRSILGIDSFIIEANETKYLSEHSIDFSLEENDLTVYEKARTFLLSRKNCEFMFEVVY